MFWIVIICSEIQRCLTVPLRAPQYCWGINVTKKDVICSPFINSLVSICHNERREQNSRLNWRKQTLLCEMHYIWFTLMSWYNIMKEIIMVCELGLKNTYKAFPVCRKKSANYESLLQLKRQQRLQYGLTSRQRCLAIENRLWLDYSGMYARSSTMISTVLRMVAFSNSGRTPTI